MITTTRKLVVDPEIVMAEGPSMMRKFLLLALLFVFGEATAGGWTKHVITEQGHCNTAVALDVNGDRHLDVIGSFNGRVSLFLAPEWTRESILHRFFRGGQGAIHSEVLDVDGDGDLDWAGSLAHGHPIWLENPGAGESMRGAWVSRVIDPEITGIHCLLRCDVDEDGRDDLLINNFLPDRGIADSMAWYRVPPRPYRAERWERHIFADGDAPGGSHYLGAADIDGDGWKEIAAGAKGDPFAGGNWFAFWKHPGRAGVREPWQKVVLCAEQDRATNILPADVNGDGRIDWVASRGHGTGVLWFENPSWQTHEIDGEIRSPHSLAVGDFDGDGDMDAAACGYESRRVMWYENDGAGGFDLWLIDDDQESYDLRAVDMDGDGDLDLLNAGRASGNVVWYENLLR